MGKRRLGKADPLLSDNEPDNENQITPSETTTAREDKRKGGSDGRGRKKKKKKAGGEEAGKRGRKPEEATTTGVLEQALLVLENALTVHTERLEKIQREIPLYLAELRNEGDQRENRVIVKAALATGRAIAPLEKRLDELDARVARLAAAMLEDEARRREALDITQRLRNDCVNEVARLVTRRGS